MAVGTALVTVEEFLRLQPPTAGHYELHHGEIILATAPKWGHQRIQDRLAALLRSMAGDRAYVTKEMSFRPAPEFEVWEADVGLTLTERANEVADDEYLMGAPELVVEVLSPSNTVDEINEKMSICMAAVRSHQNKRMAPTKERPQPAPKVRMPSWVDCRYVPNGAPSSTNGRGLCPPSRMLTRAKP
jgi:Uma2 family endonuclease